MPQFNGYLILKRPAKSYRDLLARVDTRVPALAVGEIALKLEVNVPVGLFQRPQLKASITIPEDKVTPSVLSASVLDNVKEVLEQQTGMDISIAVVEHE